MFTLSKVITLVVILCLVVNHKTVFKSVERLLKKVDKEERDKDKAFSGKEKDSK